MGAALPSTPPPAPRAKALPLQAALGRGAVRPLRAGQSRAVKPQRVAARTRELEILERVLAHMSESEIAKALGNEGKDDFGARVKSGSVVLSVGEFALLLRFGVSVGGIVELLRERVIREIAASGLDSRDPYLTNLRLMIPHLDAIAVLLVGP